MENLETDLVRVKFAGTRKISEINSRLKRSLQVNKMKDYFKQVCGLQVGVCLVVELLSKTLKKTSKQGRSFAEQNVRPSALRPQTCG